MFHLKEKPRPPRYGGRVTRGHAVDSSAMVITPGILRVREVVELPEKLDGLKIFAPAILVGNPFALLSRIIQVEHRSHRVHPQAVHMKAFAPEQRVGGQEIAHFVPAVIEDQRAPVLVRTFARVLVLIERGAVEARQRPVIPRKMRRHPVHDDTNAGFVQRVDEKLKIIGRAITGWSASKSPSPGTPMKDRRRVPTPGSNSTCENPSCLTYGTSRPANSR